MQFQEMIQRAREIRAQYSQDELKRFGKEWTKEQLVQGFVGDVGDLVKLSMAKSGVRNIENVDQKLAHELADCLWSIIVIADQYDVDLEAAFSQTMNELEERITL